MSESGDVSELLGAGIGQAAEVSVADSHVDPTAAALAAEAARTNPELAQEASAYFRKQSHLIEVQTEHLHEQRAVNLSLLKLKRFDERLKVGLRVFVILVATVIGIGGAVLIHDAVTARSVVVELFQAPPAMAADGFNGRVVASGLLDHLTRIQAATRTTAAKRALRDAWSNEISIEVPEAGVSIAQLERLLKARFGHDTTISGDVVKPSSGGVALTVRGNDVIPKTFVDPSGDLDTVLKNAAEYVYSESQPGLFSYYLVFASRYDEIFPYVRSHFARASDDDKSMMMNNWGNALEQIGTVDKEREAMSFYREAARIKPDNWNSRVNVMGGLVKLGEEEEVTNAALEMMKIAGGRPGMAPDEDYIVYDQALFSLLSERAGMLSDIAANAGGSFTDYSGPEILFAAQVDTLLHEPQTALLRSKLYVPLDTSKIDRANAAVIRASIAEEYGDFKNAAREWDELMELYSDQSVALNMTPLICWAAVAYEKTGQHSKADAALDAPSRVLGISTYLDCYRFRGDILDLRGDWNGAEEWYQKGVGRAPSLPAGYYSYGLALARHGVLDKAVEQFRLANEKGPHWADPLKAWGDVLVRQGNSKVARAKYDEALKYAPNWKQLKDARAAAAKHTG